MHSSRTITVTMPATMRKPLGPDLPDWLQEALVEALQRRSIGAAFLDVIDPEPLPAEHFL